MQIIQSPAKLMNFKGLKEEREPTEPLFPGRTKALVTRCQQLSVREIAVIMKINARMAQDVYEQFQTFAFRDTPQRAAALAYNGIAYNGLNAHDFSQEEYDFAQQQMNILSALYGLLRPFDAIKPYRLDLLLDIAPKGYSSLYHFWQDSVNATLSKKLRKEKEKIIINVASNEFVKLVQIKRLPAGTKIIDIRFLQQENSDFKQIVVHTKKARGLITRFIIKNRLTDAEDVKGFDDEGYFFYPALSKESEWVFVR
ncbi:MAG: YaaA family protein [Bacteroidales bacterium]|jgi:cytoplasmic iron level regulating protein YaaA (DUF328/UPF0246 family)|nr:YaaA family protein [Bacteroidales bacterium]